MRPLPEPLHHVEERFRPILAELLCREERLVTPDARLVVDLEADSLDVVEIEQLAADTFGLPDLNLLGLTLSDASVGDVYIAIGKALTS